MGSKAVIHDKLETHGTVHHRGHRRTRIHLTTTILGRKASGWHGKVFQRFSLVLAVPHHQGTRFIPRDLQPTQS